MRCKTKILAPVLWTLVFSVGLLHADDPVRKTSENEAKEAMVNAVADQKTAPADHEKEAMKPQVNELPEGMYARIETTRGVITCRLEFEKTPLTVCNFAGLAEGRLDTRVRSGKPYYDGLTFHRVIPDFMIQGGCPRGNGTGDPGYQFRNEIVATLRHDNAGVLAMANAGPHTNGSQFYITHKATPWLDGKHTVFGQVIEGQDVVDAIRQGDTIEKVAIIRIGEEAEAFTADQAMFDAIQADE